MADMNGRRCPKGTNGCRPHKEGNGLLPRIKNAFSEFLCLCSSVAVAAKGRARSRQELFLCPHVQPNVEARGIMVVDLAENVEGSVSIQVSNLGFMVLDPLRDHRGPEVSIAVSQ